MTEVTPKVALWTSEVLLDHKIFLKIPILFYDEQFTCVWVLHSNYNGNKMRYEVLKLLTRFHHYSFFNSALLSGRPKLEQGK